MRNSLLALLVIASSSCTRSAPAVEAVDAGTPSPAPTLSRDHVFEAVVIEGNPRPDSMAHRPAADVVAQ